jgi:hypothetical protein
VADESVYSSIVNQLQHEDEEVEQLMKEDDEESDNDDKLMSQEWMSTDFGQLDIG